MEKRQKLIILGASAIVIIAGIIFMRKSKAATIDTMKPIDDDNDIIPSSTNNTSTSTQTKVYPDTPFKSKAEGDKFRKWVREKYPTEAAKLSGGGLDATGDYNNATMKEAFYKFGKEYLKTGISDIAQSTLDAYQTSLKETHKERKDVTPTMDNVTVYKEPDYNSWVLEKLKMGNKREYISTVLGKDGKYYYKVKNIAGSNGYVLKSAAKVVSTMIPIY